MSVNAMTEEYEHIELFGKPALFTNARVDTHTVPDGWHVYDLRGSDNDPGSPCTLEILVVVNHAGSIVVPEPISLPDMWPAAVPPFSRCSSCWSGSRKSIRSCSASTMTRLAIWPAGA